MEGEGRKGGREGGSYIGRLWRYGRREIGRERDGWKA